MVKLRDEFQKVRDAEFELRFRYPTEEDKKRLRIVHREVTGKERARLRAGERSVTDLVRALKDGSLYPEDIDPNLLSELERAIRSDRGQ